MGTRPGLFSYGIEIAHVANRDERHSLRVAYNSIFRKLFSYRYFESVTILQHTHDRPTWEQLIERRDSGFNRRARNSNDNSLVRSLINWNLINCIYWLWLLTCNWHNWLYLLHWMSVIDLCTYYTYLWIKVIHRSQVSVSVFKHLFHIS